MSTLLAWIAIFFGLLWLIWPKLLRGWAVGKVSWVLFGMLLFPFFVPTFNWEGQYGFKGYLGVIGGFWVAGSILRALLGKAASHIPLIVFRAAGLLNLLSGAYVLWIKK